MSGDMKIQRNFADASMTPARVRKIMDLRGIWVGELAAELGLHETAVGAWVATRDDGRPRRRVSKAAAKCLEMLEREAESSPKFEKFRQRRRRRGEILGNLPPGAIVAFLYGNGTRDGKYLGREDGMIRVETSTGVESIPEEKIIV